MEVRKVRRRLRFIRNIENRGKKFIIILGNY